MSTELPPMSETDLAEIAARLANITQCITMDVRVGASTLRATAKSGNPAGFVGAVGDLVAATVGETGPLTLTVADDEDGQDATFALNAANDIRRLLAEVESRGRAVEALSQRCTAKGAELDETIRKATRLRTERDRLIRECDDWETKYAELSVERDALRRAPDSVMDPFEAADDIYRRWE